jgi:hypothetical protein
MGMSGNKHIDARTLLAGGGENGVRAMRVALDIERKCKDFEMSENDDMAIPAREYMKLVYKIQNLETHPKQRETINPTHSHHHSTPRRNRREHSTSSDLSDAREFHLWQRRLHGGTTWQHYDHHPTDGPAIWRANADAPIPNCLPDLGERDRLQLTLREV